MRRGLRTAIAYKRYGKVRTTKDARLAFDRGKKPEKWFIVEVLSPNGDVRYWVGGGYTKRIDKAYRMTQAQADRKTSELRLAHGKRNVKRLDAPM